MRAGTEADLPAVRAIQAASPEAAQWDAAEYLAHDFVVAVWGARVAGFVVARQVAEGEGEVLNLAVDPDFRLRGIGRRLLAEIAFRYSGELWLEVRESNTGARKFYERQGFSEAGKRRQYYKDSGEGAIVMNFHS